MQGTFYGIGVGPGDPELLTVKAVRAMEAADVIIAPKTEKKEGSVALTIAKPYLKENIEIVYQVFPMVKHFQENESDSWDKNKDEILMLLEQGKNVVFLTLGDPMFYSTYIYVFRLLKDAGARIDTIPGVPAFCAIASLLGRPIVEGDDILTVIPATAKEEAIRKALESSESVVMMKVYKNFDDMVDLLDANGMAEDAILVSRAGLDDEVRINDIKGAKGLELNYLSTILAAK
ncbi:cobalt-factor II C(20)-methyltransferase [Selenomonas sp. TAMA-11512]|uniref:precorrin-2 C(20)-methyltransferase n=1 Tax=Selenomonas sp. TAMA-11512 TaxID=3095337 RepID=UPI00308B138E|nr:cobalt-factor II C(20)-methyltransferase [Selenomonas sp. TAMA-11512]